MKRDEAAKRRRENRRKKVAAKKEQERRDAINASYVASLEERAAAMKM